MQYRLILFSTPDLRFLSSDLLDSSVDPEGEERAQAAKKVGQLLEGEYAATGAPDALVTLVVFSDFQCPYCRRLREILSAEPLITPAGKVRLIFRHLPAPDHDWAQKAAEAAACAQLQNTVAFWSLHDALFENQQEITAGNFSHELANFVARIATVKADDFNDCMARQTSLGMVLRDRQMAAALGVKGTPPMFINGEMRTGLPNAAELHRQLQRALDGAISRAVTGK